MKRTELPSNVKACIELLTHAAEDGIPDPDASHLENCNETPMFYAYTAEQVRSLLDAGADPNVHGEFGHTPLYRQFHVAVTRPTEETYALIQTLLDGGADPWMRNVDGQLPYDVAKKMNISGTIKVRGEDFLNQRLTEDGITEEQAFAAKPDFAEAMRRMREAPEIASKTIVSLMDAMKRARPMSIPEIPERYE